MQVYEQQKDSNATSWFNRKDPNSILKVNLVERPLGLEWEVDSSASKDGVFVEASSASEADRILNGTYYFSLLSLKMRLNRDMFGGGRRVMRVRYDTAFLGDKIVRCDVGSHVEGQRIPVNSSLMCQPPNFVDIDVPIC